MATKNSPSKRTVLVVVAGIGALVLAAASAAAVASAVAVSIVAPASALSPIGGSSMGSMGMGSGSSGGGSNGGDSSGTVASGPATSESGLPSVDTAGFPSGGRNPGIFTDSCTLTKMLPNDPIMMPGMTGMSMQHDFFGNPAVSASSVSKDLVGGSTSCSTTADASAYWTPVLYQDGHALTPRSTLIYWRSPAPSASSVHTMPAGMTMIAGNEAASESQSVSVIDWTCTPSAADPNPAREDAPHDCGGGASLRLVITFPNCWD
ncbi:MAG TPA: DUF1996 domain-containing protein, partial [Galbitalea sp.]|nr:DUF1996 domain-containing protein [Galbitalea sp.]